MSTQPNARRAHAFHVAALALLALPLGAYAQATPAPATPTTPAATTRPTGSLRASQALPSPVALPGVARPAASTPPPGAETRSGPSPEQLFASWDKDRNKSLSLDEFRAGVEMGRQASVITRLGALFRASDVNRNGKLEAAEYASLPLIKRGGANAPTLAVFDANKDGALDNKEYMAMIELLVKSADAQGGN
jgi:hypothetical protein